MLPSEATELVEMVILMFPSWLAGKDAETMAKSQSLWANAIIPYDSQMTSDTLMALFEENDSDFPPSLPRVTSALKRAVKNSDPKFIGLPEPELSDEDRAEAKTAIRNIIKNIG